MLRRLQLRLTVVCTAVTGVILALMAAASLHLAEGQLRERGREAFLGSLTSVVNYIGSQRTLSYAWLVQTEAAEGVQLYLEEGGRPILYVGVRQDGGGRLALVESAKELAAAQGFYLDQPPASLVQVEQLVLQVEGPQGGPYIAALAKVPLGSGWVGLAVFKNQAQQRARIVRQRLLFFGLTAATVLSLLVFSLLFTARAIRPAQESQRRQTAFVSAASHELRTPLAVISGSVSAIKSAPEKLEHYLGLIGRESARMARLVDDLLSLAGADSGTWDMRVEDTQLETLLLEAAEAFEQRAGQRGVSLSLTLPEDVLLSCRCDPQRISQVLAILLDNALSYTPPGGRVTLSGAREGGGVRLEVCDNGPGIPPADRAHIFERFYRAQASRSAKGHYGLGLSIAHEIAALHGGRLWYRETPGGGSTFALWLPGKPRRRALRRPSGPGGGGSQK